MISAILKYSIGSLLWGGFITVIFICLFIFLIKGWYKDAVFKPISFVVLGVLSLIILWNSTIVCGALSMKSDISSIQTLIENAITTLGLDANSSVDLAESNEVLQEAVKKHPILGYYADNCDFSGWSVAELPSVMCKTLKDYLNGIITKSLLWTLGFVVVGAVAVILSLDRRQSIRSSAHYSGRTSRASSRTSGKRRISRI